MLNVSQGHAARTDDALLRALACVIGTEPAAPDALGRYIVLEEIGAGAMGRIYAAFDPHLDRLVAIKVLRPGPTSADPADAERRLLVEGRALARLRHPNVLAVLDIGLASELGENVGGRGVYLVTEQVDGVDLARWQCGRTWREVAAMYEQAARGLAAVHAAGLVHRDFKPANVLVGSDGRARVGDFGLALALDEVDVGPRSSSHVAGTPAYMAPEQHAGWAVTPQSDVFAFGVALYEALYGVLPFAVSNYAALVFAKKHGVRTLLRSPTLPRTLGEALLAMLAAEPRERPTDLAVVASILAHASASSRRTWLLPAVAAVVVCAAAATAPVVPATDPCRVAGAAVEELWSDSIRDARTIAFEDSEPEYAAATWRRVSTRLDDYAERWSAARRAACDAARMSEASGEDTSVRRRVSCLDDRLRALGALLAVYATPDADVIAHAVVAAEALPSIEACEHIDVDGSAPGGSSALQEQLARARALGDAGRHDAAADLIDGLLDESREAGPAQLADALLARGSAHASLGRFELARRDLEEAYFTAVGIGRNDVAIGAGNHLVFLLGYREANVEAGRIWARHVRALIGVRSIEPALAVDFRAAEGHLLHREGRLREALAMHESALSVATDELGANHPRVADSLRNIGAVQAALGRYDEAVATLERLLARQRTSLGTGNPLLAFDHNNLGFVHFERGAIAQSLAEHQIALAIRERALPSDHPDIAESVLNIGTTLLESSDHAEAERWLTRALVSYRRAYGPFHPDTALALQNLAVLADRRGRPAEAAAFNERAIAALESSGNLATPQAAVAFDNLAMALADLERGVEAETMRARAREVRDSLGL